MSEIAAGAARIFADFDLAALEAAGDAAPLWRALEAAGFVGAWAGAGLSVADGFAVIAETGRAALPAPLAETMAAGWLLAAAGIDPPAGPATLLDGRRAAFGGAGAHAAALAGGEARLLRVTAAAARTQDVDGAADILETETIAAAPAPDWLGPDQWRGFGAAMRAAQIAGACEAVLRLTLDYTQGREQFGRPLSKFQAIQHQLSDIAGEAAAAAAAAAQAARAVEADPRLGEQAMREVAAAKIRCGQAAGRVAAMAHQCHGAMGFTAEYALGRYTRRLWRWRDEFGAESWWSRRLGASILAAGPLWPQIAR